MIPLRFIVAKPVADCSLGSWEGGSRNDHASLSCGEFAGVKGWLSFGIAFEGVEMIYERTPVR